MEVGRQEKQPKGCYQFTQQKKTTQGLLPIYPTTTHQLAGTSLPHKNPPTGWAYTPYKNLSEFPSGGEIKRSRSIPLRGRNQPIPRQGAKSTNSPSRGEIITRRKTTVHTKPEHQTNPKANEKGQFRSYYRFLTGSRHSQNLFLVG